MPAKFMESWEYLVAELCILWVSSSSIRTGRSQRVIGRFECGARLAWFQVTLQQWSAYSNVVFAYCKMDNDAYLEFLRLHRAALTTMNVPEIYWPTVYTKLQGKVFDASEKFELGMLNYLNDDNEPVESKLFVSVKVDEIKASDPSSHKMQETLPDPSAKLADNKKTPLLVYTDMDLVAGTLTSSNYKLTDNRDEADIIWTRKHIRDYEHLSRTRANVYVNQFPNESVVTVKDLLAAVAATEAAIEISGPGDAYDIQPEDESEEEVERSSSKRALIASWYPITFNLYYELAQFVAFFQRRAEEIGEVGEEEEGLENGKGNDHLAECSHDGSCLRCGKDGRHVSFMPTSAKQHNIWIVKPWNLGRGLGICISDNLDQIIRLNETNPMIASRYITDPVLFYREDISSWVKFDVRYIVYLKSVQPLQLYSHKVFWLRFANTQFSLDHFDDYSKHFTVMNYREEDELFQVHHNDFIQRFESQYPNAVWKDIEAKIHKMLVNVFKSATAYEPPRGLGAYGKSRALYAVDLLLEWRRCPEEIGDSCGFIVEPQICEVNFIPDCTRACQYYPDFHNEAFDFLFLDKESQDILQLC
nr:tubulin tyrosine ligase protein 12 [Hymenolepis microstoma]